MSIVCRHTGIIWAHGPLVERSDRSIQLRWAQPVCLRHISKSDLRVPEGSACALSSCRSLAIYLLREFRDYAALLQRRAVPALYNEYAHEAFRLVVKGRHSVPALVRGHDPEVASGRRMQDCQGYQVILPRPSANR